MRITPVTMYRSPFLKSGKQNIGFGLLGEDNKDKGILRDCFNISLLDFADRELYNFFNDTEIFTLKRGIKQKGAPKNAIPLPYITKNMDAIEKEPKKDEILKLCDELRQMTLKNARPGDNAYIYKDTEPDFVAELDYVKAQWLLNKMRIM